MSQEENNDGGNREPVKEGPVAIAPGLVLGDKYQIVSLIGRGGMGSVYEAREIDFEIDRTVAVKVLSPTMLAMDEEMAERRFRDEIKILAQMNHPNIVPVFNVGRFGSSLFFVMNYIEGITLNEMIRRLGPFPEENIRKIGKQIAGAVTHIHKVEAIHRDIKSNNIMVNEDLHATLMDFGIARSKDAQTRLTVDGQVLGTGPYLSPEQWDGKVDHRSDIYAMGVVLYEMAVGRLPFEAESIPQLMKMILHQQEGPLQTLRPDLSPHLCEVIHRCMKKEPDERFQTMEELRKELAENRPDVLSSASMKNIPPIPAQKQFGVASIPSTQPEVAEPQPQVFPEPRSPKPATRSTVRPRRRKRNLFGRLIQLLVLGLIAILILSRFSPSLDKKVKIYTYKAKAEFYKVWNKLK